MTDEASNLRVVVEQLDLPFGDVAGNVTTLVDRLGRAAEQGADLVVFPELATTGYATVPEIEALTEPIDGPSITAIRDAAATSGVAACLGFAEVDEATGRRFNSSVLIGADGSVLAHHRKTHLWAGENDRFEPSDTPTTTAQLGSFRVGLLICYEVEFPELVRRLALDGVDLVVVPTAVTDLGTSDVFSTQIVGARATENNLFIAYANHAGEIDGAPALGASIIAGPLCSTLALAGAEPATLMADLDLTVLERGRAELPYLRDRRPDLY